MSAADWPGAAPDGLGLELIGNPFRSQTEIRFAAPEGSPPVTLSVFDVGGRLVRTIADRSPADGWNVMFWDGRDDGGMKLSTGVYFIRLEWSGETRSGRMLLLR